MNARWRGSFSHGACTEPSDQILAHLTDGPTSLGDPPLKWRGSPRIFGPQSSCTLNLCTRNIDYCSLLGPRLRLVPFVGTGRRMKIGGPSAEFSCGYGHSVMSNVETSSVISDGSVIRRHRAVQPVPKQVRLNLHELFFAQRFVIQIISHSCRYHQPTGWTLKMSLKRPAGPLACGRPKSGSALSVVDCHHLSALHLPAVLNKPSPYPYIQNICIGKNYYIG